MYLVEIVFKKSEFAAGSESGTVRGRNNLIIFKNVWNKKGIQFFFIKF